MHISERTFGHVERPPNHGGAAQGQADHRRTTAMKRALVPSWIAAYAAELRFCVRTTTAGLLAFALAQVLNFPLHGLWVILTAIVVMQMSAGGSFRATIEYMIGTLGGAAFAGIVGILIPHETVIAQGTLLALTIAPLALAAAFNPNFRVAPFSAALVLLISGQLGEGPIESAVTRFAEVTLGGLVAVAVSLFVFPEGAHGLSVKAAVRILDQLAQTLPKILSGFTHKMDPIETSRLQNEIGGAVSSFQAIVAEAKHEPFIGLTGEPDSGPLSRTLLRLRHDLVIIGRAAAMPLPDIFVERLGPLLTRLGERLSDFLRASAHALDTRSRPPALDVVEAALRAYSSEVTATRGEGLTLKLSTDEAENLFALGFGLEQMHQNLGDLQRCARECARGFVRNRPGE
jgi:hypothetical protein